MKFFSIMGDSISTFEGYNPEGNAVFFDRFNQSRFGLTDVGDTWWAKVIKALGGELCVNNSYSGSRVSGKGFPAASSQERIAALRTTSVSPDVILVFIGFNDYGYGVKQRKYGSLDNIIDNDRIPDPEYFDDAYAIMLNELELKYPYARIVCGTMLRTTLRGEEDWEFPEYFDGKSFDSYNERIRRICLENRCILADLNETGIKYETLDGSHPTAAGHASIAEAWLRCLEATDIAEATMDYWLAHLAENKNDIFARHGLLKGLFSENVLANYRRPLIGNKMYEKLVTDGNGIAHIYTQPGKIPSSVREEYRYIQMTAQRVDEDFFAHYAVNSGDEEFIISREALRMYYGKNEPYYVRRLMLLTKKEELSFGLFSDRGINALSSLFEIARNALYEMDESDFMREYILPVLRDASNFTDEGCPFNLVSDDGNRAFCIREQFLLLVCSRFIAPISTEEYVILEGEEEIQNVKWQLDSTMLSFEKYFIVHNTSVPVRIIWPKGGVPYFDYYA